MVSEQLNTKWSSKDKLELDTLCEMLGLNPQIYGRYPQALKFAVTYTIQSLKQLEKVIPTLPEKKWLMLVSSIKQSKLTNQKVVDELKT